MPEWTVRAWASAFMHEEGMHALSRGAEKRIGQDADVLARSVWKDSSVSPDLHSALILAYGPTTHTGWRKEAGYGAELIRAVWQVFQGGEITEETIPWLRAHAVLLRTEIEKWEANSAGPRIAGRPGNG